MDVQSGSVLSKSEEVGRSLLDNIAENPNVLGGIAFSLIAVGIMFQQYGQR